MSFRKILQRFIDETNQGAKKDHNMKEALKKYDGKRVFLNVIGDTTYAVAISSEAASLILDATPHPEDMSIEMNRETAQKIVDQEISPLQLTSMIFSGKIKIRNIGKKEIELIRKLYRGF